MGLALTVLPGPAVLFFFIGASLLWETSAPYTYLRTTKDDRIIIGGYDEPFSDADARDRLLNAKASILLLRFRHLLPRLPVELA